MRKNPVFAKNVSNFILLIVLTSLHLSEGQIPSRSQTPSPSPSSYLSKSTKKGVFEGEFGLGEYLIIGIGVGVVFGLMCCLWFQCFRRDNSSFRSRPVASPITAFGGGHTTLAVASGGGHTYPARTRDVVDVIEELPSEPPRRSRRASSPLPDRPMTRAEAVKSLPHFSTYGCGGECNNAYEEAVANRMKRGY